MFFKKKGLPQRGELVICTVAKILPHAAFVRLDEYERVEAMLHVSEISTRWVKNIKEHITEGKKIVCKVLQIDEQKKHVDVSLKRVTNSEKNRKLNAEKTNVRIEKLIELIAKKMKLQPKKALLTVGAALINYFGSLSDFYELTKKEGVAVIDEVDIEDKWKKELKSAIQEQLDALNVKIIKKFEMWTYEPDGIDRIKKLFSELDKSTSEKGVKINFSYISSPTYMLNFIAKNYKEGEAFLEEVLEELQKIADKNKIEIKVLE